jgi:uncharacterized membrane protein YeaQ/YmgE (transglycosylase-associated protein family)
VGATATEVTQSIQDTGKSAVSGIETLWKRIDERRLKNRTFDELVAWALMGLLVGGALHRFTKLSQTSAVFLGLAGAFVGGIIANVLQLDLGLGPVLIRYEDLLCSLAGGFLLLFAWNWYRERTASKPQPAEKKVPTT